MKNLVYILFFLFFSINLLGNTYELNFTVPKDEICNFKILEEDSVCKIVEIELSDGTYLINVISAIGTYLLPSVAKGVCEYAGGSQSECGVVNDVFDKLVSFSGRGIYKGISRGMRWVAKKMGYYEKSSAIVETRTWEAAKRVSQVFSLYNKIHNLNWETPQYEEGNHYQSYKNKIYQSYPFRFINYSEYNIPFELSRDGINWVNSNLNNWKGIEHYASKSQGYIRINNYDVFNIFSNQDYILYYDELMREIKISKPFKSKIEIRNPYSDLIFTYSVSMDRIDWKTSSIEPYITTEHTFDNLMKVYIYFNDETYKIEVGKRYIIQYDETYGKYRIFSN